MGEFEDWDELGPPEVRPVPAGHPRLRRAAVAAAVIVAGTFLVAIGALLIVRGGGGPAVPGKAGEATTTVTESFTVTASVSATSTVATPTVGATSTVPAFPRFTRATKVAYRLGGALWVAEESGAGPQKVATSAAGAFALSPDGATLAVVDAASKRLVLVEVGSSRVATVGPADVRSPVWAPSSQWVAFTNGAEVRRVAADGSGLRYLGKGTHVAVGPDAAAFAYAGEGAVTYVDASGKQTRIPVRGRVDDLALGSDRLFYAVGGASRSVMSVRSVALDGSCDKQLAGSSADTKAGMYDELALSPDGSWLAYAVAGDDLHSRLRAMHTDGSADTALSLRHDDYLVKWSADGTTVLFIDGNVLQGEATQLMSVRPDGTLRTSILKGAGI